MISALEKISEELLVRAERVKLQRVSGATWRAAKFVAVSKLLSQAALLFREVYEDETSGSSK